jgi:hypothetical protein
MNEIADATVPGTDTGAGAADGLGRTDARANVRAHGPGAGAYDTGARRRLWRASEALAAAELTG